MKKETKKERTNVEKKTNVPKFIKAHYEQKDLITVGQSIDGNYVLLLESINESGGKTEECMILSEKNYHRLFTLMLTHAKHYQIDIYELLKLQSDSNNNVIYVAPPIQNLD